MWWHTETKVQTGVMDLVIYDSNYKRIKHFASPNKISLKRYATNQLDFINGTLNVLWTPETIDVTMNVTKVILSPGDGLMLHFNNLDDKTFIDVVGVIGNRPIYEDFEKATVISKENPTFNLNIEEHFTIATDVYVGILPSKKMFKQRFRRQAEGGDLKLEYQVAFETPKCISWIEGEKTWAGINCKVKTFTSTLLSKIKLKSIFCVCEKVGINSTSDRIHCDCYGGTTFAATFTKTERIAADSFQQIKISLNDYFEAHYLIFSNVFVAFLIYCWACSLWIIKRNKNQVTKPNKPH